MLSVDSVYSVYADRQAALTQKIESINSLKDSVSRLATTQPDLKRLATQKLLGRVSMLKDFRIGVISPEYAPFTTRGLFWKGMAIAIEPGKWSFSGSGGKIPANGYYNYSPASAGYFSVGYKSNPNLKFKAGILGGQEANNQCYTLISDLHLEAKPAKNQLILADFSAPLIERQLRSNLQTTQFSMASSAQQLSYSGNFKGDTLKLKYLGNRVGAMFFNPFTPFVRRNQFENSMDASVKCSSKFSLGVIGRWNEYGQVAEQNHSELRSIQGQLEWRPTKQFMLKAAYGPASQVIQASSVQTQNNFQATQLIVAYQKGKNQRMFTFSAFYIKYWQTKGVQLSQMQNATVNASLQLKKFSAQLALSYNDMLNPGADSTFNKYLNGSISANYRLKKSDLSLGGQVFSINGGALFYNYFLNTKTQLTKGISWVAGVSYKNIGVYQPDVAKTSIQPNLFVNTAILFNW